MDQTAKLWDITTGRCRQTFRGHVDAINSISFQPFSNNICTGSGDKTVSLWDSRSGLCIQTFYGHKNAINSVSFSLQGGTIVSADADGGRSPPPEWLPQLAFSPFIKPHIQTHFIKSYIVHSDQSKISSTLNTFDRLIAFNTLIKNLTFHVLIKAHLLPSVLKASVASGTSDASPR